METRGTEVEIIEKPLTISRKFNLFIGFISDILNLHQRHFRSWLLADEQDVCSSKLKSVLCICSAIHQIDGANTA